jgi:hypothetical protein
MVEKVMINSIINSVLGQDISHRTYRVSTAREQIDAAHRYR